MLAALLFASCNVMEDPLHSDGECETEPVNVRLILSMMGGRGLSRAPLTDTPTSETYLDEEPLGNEYYINPYDVEVLVFTCGETPEASTFVERASMVRASETNYYYQYQLDGTLTKILEGTAYRMVVLANMNGSCYTTGAIALVEGTTTMKDYLHSLAYTGYTANFTNSLLTSDTERIPMWGTTAAYLNDGAQINMDLLRAMAKVKVKMAKSLGNLSAVTLEYANDGGYVTPLLTKNGDESTTGNPYGVSAITNNSGTKTIEGGKTQRVRTTRIPDDDVETILGITENENILNFSKVNNTNENEYDEYVIYVPEYKNLNLKDGKKQARMKLAIGDKEYELEFKDYSANNTGYFDIIRNYYYQYEITSVGKTLEFTADIYSWGSATKVVEIIVEDFHWLYVKDKVLYMNNVNEITTTFDSSTDDLQCEIVDGSVLVYNTNTGWDETNNGTQSVDIEKKLNGEITIKSAIPNNFVGKEFKVRVWSKTSGKSETIQVYQFPPLYVSHATSQETWEDELGQDTKSMFIFNSLLPDLSSIPIPDYNNYYVESNNNYRYYYENGTKKERWDLRTEYVNYLKNAVYGYPQTTSTDKDNFRTTGTDGSTNEGIYIEKATVLTTITSEENNRLISPHFMLASQAGMNSGSETSYSTEVDFCQRYMERDEDGNQYGPGVWRVPTKAELCLIDVLQNIEICEVKDILQGGAYWNATQSVLVMLDPNTGSNYDKGAVRCVRDIK